MILRPYQRAACDAFYAFLDEGGISALIELATGLGKSLVNAMVIKELMARYPSLRIVCLTHRKELIAQNFKELLKLWPAAPAGINSAGIGRRDWRPQILFCGIQSVHRHAALIGHADLVIIDECHLLSLKAATMYQRFLHELRVITPDMRLLGLTATGFRLDSGRLDQGDDDRPPLFDKTVYKYGIGEGIRDGYLSPLISKAMLAEIDTRGVHTRGGEFVQHELEARAMASNLVRRACDEIIQYGDDRHAWLVFCAGVKHAEAVTAEMRRRGIPFGIVTGDTKRKAERKQNIEAFERGELRGLANIDVLTTGSNFPKVDLIALLRPTKSPGLAVQTIGRGTRLINGDIGHLETAEDRLAAIGASDKPNCLILDFASILKTHGPVDTMSPPIKEKRGKRQKAIDLPVRICPECNGIMPLHTRVCDQCGHAWKTEPSEPQHDDTADGVSAVLSSQGSGKWLPVTSWAFSVHQKKPEEGKKRQLPTLRVRYRCGLNLTISEFWAFEHTGQAHARAVMRWQQLRRYEYARSFFVPQSVAEAMENAEEYLICPAEIMVRPNGKYFEVVKVAAWERKNAA